MATEGQTFEQWLRGARVRPERLSDAQRAVLQATFQFLQESTGDYSTSRIASHFLLHCGVGLQVTQIARLIGIDPRSAFRHQKLSAKQVGQQIHYHFSGRPYGKLLPRHAGPIAEFLFTHPQATRDELLDFIARTWEFRVSKVALWEFLKKYGMDRASLEQSRQAAAREAEQRVQVEVLDATPSGGSVPMVPDNFFLARPSTRARFSCGRKRAAGSTRPAIASTTTTARCCGAS
jgi:transposase